jgi:hypothetical protein
MRRFKNAGAVIAGIAALVVLLFVSLLLLHGLVWVSETLLTYAIDACGVAFAISLFVVLPLAMFRTTRAVSIYGLLVASIIFGVTTCIVGVSATDHFWGGTVLYIGLFFGIVGVVPLGMLGSLFHAEWYVFGVFGLGLVLTFGSGFLSSALAAKVDRDEQSYA